MDGTQLHRAPPFLVGLRSYSTNCGVILLQLLRSLRRLRPSTRRSIMRETRITLPELVLVAGTRAALGAGLGLLLADRLSADQRRAVGWTLFLVGALSTIP